MTDWIHDLAASFAKRCRQEAEMRENEALVRNFMQEFTAYYQEHEQEQTFAAGECPVCGHDWSCHGEFIQKGERTCVVFDGTGTHTFTFCEQEQEEMDEFTKGAHFCGECGRIYQWSADDIAWEYEKPFMPCGHLWRFLDKPLPVVVMEDEIIHTDERPFCWDPECPCHGNPETYHELVDIPFREGLLTEPEATRLFLGRQV